ncbi:MAG: PAS domain-containing protein, partial [Bacteroidota bacterium]
VHPEDRKEMITYMREEVLDNKQPFKKSYRIITKDTKRIKWIFGNGSLIENHRGEVVEMFGIIQDITEQYQRESDLAEAKEVLQNISDNIPGLIYQYILHADGTDSLPFVSRGIQDLFEIEWQESIQDSSAIWQRIHLEDVPQVQATIMESAKTLKNWESEFRLQMEDGRMKWIVARGVPKKLSNGDIFWNSVALEITPQREVEEELRKSTLLLNSINQNINEGIYRSNKDGLIYANQSVVRMFGYNSMDELMSVAPTAFYERPAQRSEIRELLLQNRRLNGKEVRFVRKDGSAFWASVNVTCSLDEYGNEIFDGAIRDITIRKQAEEKLLQSEQKFRFLVEKITDIVVLWDKDFNYKYISPAVEQMLGYTLKEYESFNILGNIPKEDRPKILSMMQKLRKGESHLELDHRAIRKDGKVLWLRNQTKAFRDEKGEIINVLTTSSDITELVERQEELRKLLHTTTTQNNRLKEFSYITSHNIRSSVANLLGLTDLLNSDPGNPQYVRMINQSTERLDKTIKNINVLLQIEQDSKLLGREVVGVLETVERALEQNTKSIQEQNVEIEIDIPKTLELKTIPVYLDSIVQNFITNALKYGITLVSQKIEVRAYIEDDTACLEVQDYGRGIDLEKDGNQLFKLGTRLHDVSTGQGLGLYMSKRQAEILGGQIEVESKVNQGTTFRLCLPVASTEELEEETSIDLTLPTSNK